MATPFSAASLTSRSYPYPSDQLPTSRSNIHPPLALLWPSKSLPSKPCKQSLKASRSIKRKSFLTYQGHRASVPQLRVDTLPDLVSLRADDPRLWGPGKISASFPYKNLVLMVAPDTPFEDFRVQGNDVGLFLQNRHSDFDLTIAPNRLFKGAAGPRPNYLTPKASGNTKNTRKLSCSILIAQRRDSTWNAIKAHTRMQPAPRS